ncbi:MAG: phosphoribosylformylglycinamidine synthase [Fusobacteriaceae bacterium]|nr:phosphoribosylformylglycinamidine synthase [Fusobacteriaceae bacterium]
MDSRIYVEKKPGFDLEAKRLAAQLRESLNLNKLTDLRILNIYDVFGIGRAEMDAACKGIFGEIVTDDILRDPAIGENKAFAVEFIPGQFDQRADSAMQCLNLLSEKNQGVTVTSGKLIILAGEISDRDLERVKRWYINPIETREKDLTTIAVAQGESAPPVATVTGFVAMEPAALKAMREDWALAMSEEDLAFVQNYFRNEEKRDPTETEIRVLDTYWSDHCRHTTFLTEIEDIVFPAGKFGETLQACWDRYLQSRKTVYGEMEADKAVCLMDLATLPAKEMRKAGLLPDLELSDEVNACSVYVDVDVDGKTEPWLLMFKNETHNHPTEIEPYGGASTCLGGAIRDPLSGRAYVYQAIRVTGSGNPLEKLEDTLPGKLPQRKITTGAAAGYSAYGNQIGLTTCHVTEIYHEGYKAKRLEVGAVVGAAPASWVRREKPVPGDVVILLGGKTGRDGCGGATGSSKEHTGDSLALCGAEVQKGNAPEERKIQRLFRNPAVTKLIKKCNDFGAGGVSVAIGELADGLDITLDVVPVKYSGLSGTELAISESQERMAVLVSKEDVDVFIGKADAENLEATPVAVVTETPRLRMSHKGRLIVDIARAFLDTNGVRQKTAVVLKAPVSSGEEIFHPPGRPGESLSERWYALLQDLNVASQKGLMDIFDSTIGASSVFMPFGGKYQLTPTDLSIQKLPVLAGDTHTASAISWGYNPEISSWSPCHGAAYAVVESLAKLAAAGCDTRNVRLSFQEYFRKMGTDPVNWGKPVAALLGAIEAQKALGVPAIGGKDSMSGTFNDLHVPPTLISFAVTTCDARNVISPEFKGAGHRIYVIEHRAKEDKSPDYESLIKNFRFLYENIGNGKILSAMAVKSGGVAEALSKMAFGNRIGVRVTDSDADFFGRSYGSVVVEAAVPLPEDHARLLGETIGQYVILAGDEMISLERGEALWLAKLHPVFPYKTEEKADVRPVVLYPEKKIFLCKHKAAKPHVLIGAFPGTNSEYDSARKFDRYGGESEIFVFRNLTQRHIDESIEGFVKALANSQIFMVPGGFSAGDEPDGSGKFIATVLTNEKVAAAVRDLLRRDGLILGICNGFQALIKSGLLPYGDIGGLTPASPTVTFNKIGRHVCQMVRLKVVSANSPWLQGIEPGAEFTVPISHGEGRFYASPEVIEELMKNGQIATRYVDLSGNITTEYRYNPNGSEQGIEGILSPDGRVYGKMGHNERWEENVFKNIEGNKDFNIFQNGIKYFL